MAKISRLAVNSDLATTGVWKSWILDVRFKIARLSNPEMQAWMRVNRTDDLTDEELVAVTKRGVSLHVLKDWEGVEDEAGPIEASPDNFLKILLTEGMDPAYIFILEEATKADNYRKKSEADNLGN